MMIRTFSLLLTLACALVAHAKLNIIATTSDLGAIAREVGGDDVKVTVLARPTEDPHFVDAKPSFLVQMSRADLLIEGGAELEAAWLAPLIDGSRNPKLQRGAPGHFAANQGVQILEVPSTLDRSQGDIHAAGNPHYLTDPVNAKLTIFNGGNTILVFVLPDLGPTFVTVGKIIHKKDGPFDYTLDFTIPPIKTLPSAPDASVGTVDTKTKKQFFKKGKKKYSLIVAPKKCTGTWKAEGDFYFADGSVVKTPVSSKCKK